MRLAWWIGPAALVASASAHAQSVQVDAPAGQAAKVAVVIARQTGTSIVIVDRQVAERKVGAIRGRFTPEEAIARLARACGARAISAGASGWRLVAVAQAAALQPRAAPAPRPSEAAPPPPPAESPDIVVVGSKREVPLVDFAGQVEIIDGEDLTFGGVGGTEKIMQRIPTVASTYLGSGRNKLFIRGIADSSFTGPTQSTVGQYLGDLRLSYNAPDPDLRLSDLARVEVLEGPQGTLYGAGSLGGIVRLVPNEPELGWAEGAAMVGGSATQHGALGGDASATANLPLIGDAAALRVTVNAETQGGYIDKPLIGRENVNRTDIYSGRASVARGARVRLDGRRDRRRPADQRPRQPVRRPRRPAAEPRRASDRGVRCRFRARPAGGHRPHRRRAAQVVDRDHRPAARGALRRDARQRAIRACSSSTTTPRWSPTRPGCGSRSASGSAGWSARASRTTAPG